MAKTAATSFCRKFILFIVEGASDLAFLESPLQKLYDSAFPGKYRVKIHYTSGDLMSRLDANAKTVLKALDRNVKAALDKGRFVCELEDIEMIIQIVDLDGVFIPNSCVEFKPGQKKAWYDDKQGKIFTDKPDKIRTRNKTKSTVLRELIQKRELFFKSKRKKGKTAEEPEKLVIPYRVFFFSCNADHVFLNEANLKMDDIKTTEKEKKKRSNEFQERAEQQPYLFENRILEFSTNKLEYEESWKWPEAGVNSLQRRTNLDILVKPLLNTAQLT
ncbi:hypothetical protein [Succiniclasticum ruminis]|nr:hypothetical protein [Succiniclasticum ruminis]